MESIRLRTGFTVDEHTGCWYYNNPASTGFGPYLAYYEAAYSEVPEGMEVFHLCRGGRRGCIRPRHLDIAPAGSAISHVRDPAISPESRREFKDRIKMERQARKATLKGMAAELGVAQSTYRDWERGISAPTQGTFDEIARKMGWDGHVRRFQVVVAVERIVPARSAGEAAETVLDELSEEGRPLKAEIIRAKVKV